MARFTEITQKTKEYWCVNALSQSSRGMPVRDEEEKIEVLCKRLGGQFMGAGTSISTGQRDYSYAFPSHDAATSFVMRAVNARLVKNKVVLHKYCLNWVPVGNTDFVGYKKACK